MFIKENQILIKHYKNATIKSNRYYTMHWRTNTDKSKLSIIHRPRSQIIKMLKKIQVIIQIVRMLLPLFLQPLEVHSNNNC